MHINYLYISEIVDLFYRIWSSLIIHWISISFVLWWIYSISRYFIYRICFVYIYIHIKTIRIALDDVEFKEKKALETCRLDLDAAKAKLKKVKTLEMRDQVENEVQAAQVNYICLVNYTKVTLLYYTWLFV